MNRGQNYKPAVAATATAATTSTLSTSANHQDWVFFRGFSGKRKEDLVLPSSSEPYSSGHGPLLALEVSSPVPQAPPRRKRAGAKAKAKLRRSMSLTDAHFIAQVKSIEKSL